MKYFSSFFASFSLSLNQDQGLTICHKGSRADRAQHVQISANKFARIVQVVCQVLQHGRAPGETRLLHPPAGSQEPDRVSRTLLELGGGCVRVRAVPGDTIFALIMARV